MKMASVFVALVMVVQLSELAFANQTPLPVKTHGATVQVTLSWRDTKGKVEKINSDKASMIFSWKAKSCELNFGKKLQKCVFDNSKDLMNANGELVMKSIPMIHLTGGTIDLLINQIAEGEKKYSALITSVLAQTAAERVAGLDLPFYECGRAGTENGECLKNGNDLLLFNAFKKGVEISREVSIFHPRFGDKSLVLSLTIKDITAYRGNLQITGDNAVGNFGN